MRSVMAPPTNDEITIGASVAAATSPILLALPVVSSTSHGTAITVMLLPRLEIRLAVSIQMTGQRFVDWPVEAVGEDIGGSGVPAEGRWRIRANRSGAHGS